MEDLHKRWPHRWLTPKASPGNSPIHRYGVFAKEKIFRGEPINVFGGIAIPKTDIKEYRNIMGHAGLQVSDNFFIVPSDKNELTEQGIFNHSCEPNIGFDSSVTMVAIEDINPGEELVINYAFVETYFDAFACNCGSKSCRGEIDSDTWRDPEFIEQYSEYYSPYLKDKLKG
ncbi:MAG: SET domain-containing protein-lysine N-methyltransferase [Candidatus Colwellbacteria bacterium]|nr:SET domain-containing protein-lysine N-methyltransferase [Candidatus Colwellbacteria bacterium]